MRKATFWVLQDERWAPRRIRKCRLFLARDGWQLEGIRGKEERRERLWVTEKFICAHAIKTEKMRWDELLRTASTTVRTVGNPICWRDPRYYFRSW